MAQVNIHQAKTHLSRLLTRVAAGEEIIIAKAGRPIARLVPLKPKTQRRVLGQDAGQFEVPEDFDAPLQFLADSQQLAHRGPRGACGGW